MAVKEEPGDTLVATNRKARYEYAVIQTYETGIVLKGTEVKSLRQKQANIADGYAMIRNGELWLEGTHISPYAHGSYSNVDPLRRRKLLVHKKELRKIVGQMQDKGLTLIPLKVYFTHGIAKVLLGVCRGKREYDKRQDIAKRDAERAIRRHVAG
jgi:SsrA-binding protein